MERRKVYAAVKQDDIHQGQHREEDDDSSYEYVDNVGDNDDNSQLIPIHLRNVIFPCHGDFFQTPIFHHKLIAAVMAEGFLPIATRGVLLPKLHKERSVVTLPTDLHISKNVRKRSNKFYIKINTNFRGVVSGCHRQHGKHCWLYNNLVSSFQQIYDNSTDGIGVRIYRKNGQPTKKICKVRVYSIEIYKKSQEEEEQDSNDRNNSLPSKKKKSSSSSDKLVGGELGYTVGSIYTSLTGFSNEDSAGSVQLGVLGKLLCINQFTLWDLGMDMEYKNKLGAHLMKRSQFLKHVHNTRKSYNDNDNTNNLSSPMIKLPFQPSSLLPLQHQQYQQNCMCARDIIDHGRIVPKQQQAKRTSTKMKGIKTSKSSTFATKNNANIKNTSSSKQENNTNNKNNEKSSTSNTNRRKDTVKIVKSLQNVSLKSSSSSSSSLPTTISSTATLTSIETQTKHRSESSQTVARLTADDSTMLAPSNGIKATTCKKQKT